MYDTQSDWKVDFEETLQSIHESKEALYKRDQRVLIKQRRKLPPYLLSELESILDFYDNTWGYVVVDNFGSGTKLKDTFFNLRHIFDDSEHSQCMAGEWGSSGTVWVPIKNGNYFKFEYYC